MTTKLSDLREALGHAIAYLIRPDAPPLSPDQRVKIANHLRRFLALAETGPDYEAAMVAWSESKWLSADQEVRRIVDAALADYLEDSDVVVGVIEVEGQS